jgi:hypothetical protein
LSHQRGALQGTFPNFLKLKQQNWAEASHRHSLYPGFSLTLGFSHDGKLHSQGVQDGIDGLKAGVRACAQGFVQALPAQSCVFGDLRSATCFGHLAERGDEYCRVGVLGRRGKILRNDCIVIEIWGLAQPFPILLTLEGAPPLSRLLRQGGEFDLPEGGQDAAEVKIPALSLQRTQEQGRGTRSNNL